MPPKKLSAKASAKTHQRVYDLCYNLLEESHEVLVYEGRCNSSVHRYCAGVTHYHYEKLTAGAEPFVCLFCLLKTHRALVSQLSQRLRVSRRTSEHEDCPAGETVNPGFVLTEPGKLPPTYVTAMSGGGIETPLPTTTSNTKAKARFITDKKYNVVLNGVVECPPGSSHLACFGSDLDSVVTVLSDLDSNIQCQSTGECHR